MCIDSEIALSEILSTNIVDVVIEFATMKNANIKFERNVIWIMANLCRCSPLLLDRVAPLLSVFNAALLTSDSEILIEALNGITQVEEKSIKLVMEYINFERVLYFLTTEDEEVKCAAIKAIGGLCFGSDKVITKLLKTTLLQSIKAILKNSKSVELLQSTCWTLSNIAFGPKEHIQALIDSELFPLLCEIIESTVASIVFF
jgi:importin subunit alpha-2